MQKLDITSFVDKRFIRWYAVILILQIQVELFFLVEVLHYFQAHETKRVVHVFCIQSMHLSLKPCFLAQHRKLLYAIT